MASIGISVYGLRLQSYKTKDLYRLDKVGFLQYIRDFITNYNQDYSDSKRYEKVFKVHESWENTYTNNEREYFDYITGVVKTGAYGYESEIIDPDTGAVIYYKQEGEAEVMPFFFSIAIPRGATDRGILILQNHGTFGIKGVFKDFLHTYLKNIDNDYDLIIGNIAPREYITRYLDEGILQKIRFLRYDIPLDKAEQIGLNQGVKSQYEEYIIHSPVGFKERKRREIGEFIRGARMVNNIVQIENFEYDNIKLDFKLGKKYKTINLSNIDNLVVNEDITDEVDLVGGHPTKESIYPIIKETFFEYLSQMGLV